MTIWSSGGRWQACPALFLPQIITQPPLKSPQSLSRQCDMVFKARSFETHLEKRMLFSWSSHKKFADNYSGRMGPPLRLKPGTFLALSKRLGKLFSIDYAFSSWGGAVFVSDIVKENVVNNVEMWHAKLQTKDHRISGLFLILRQEILKLRKLFQHCCASELPRKLLCLPENVV